MMPLNVEVLTSNYCESCEKIKALVLSVIAEISNSDIHYREVDVVTEIDYAVDLGVMRLPAIALNGRLTFMSFPERSALRQAILAELPGISDHSPSQKEC